MRHHDVYLLRDQRGQLLYIGVSLSSAQRLSDHRRSKSWWPEVASIDIEHCDDREHALEREAQLIRELHPEHNIALNDGEGLYPHDQVPPDPRRWAQDYLRLQQREAIDAIKAAWKTDTERREAEACR